MREKIIGRVLFALVMAASTAVVGTFFLSSETKVSGQQDKGWKVWVKTSPCSGGRTDWVTVAKENPSTGGGGSSWMLADTISGNFLCTRAADTCGFALANVTAGKVRSSDKFFDYCCRDYSVWENTNSKEMSAVRGSGSAGFGWRFVKGNLCCEEAEALSGKTGLCGSKDGTSAFTGRWKVISDLGDVEVRLTQTDDRVTGTFTGEYISGEIDGTVTGSVLSFKWKSGSEKGTGEVKLSDDGKSFTGYLSDNASNTRNSLTGKKSP